MEFFLHVEMTPYSRVSFDGEHSSNFSLWSVPTVCDVFFFFFLFKPITALISKSLCCCTNWCTIKFTGTDHPWPMHRERMVLCRSLMTDVTENVLGLLNVLKRKSRSLWKWLCSFASIAASFIVCLKRVTLYCWRYIFNRHFPQVGILKTFFG